MKRRLLAVLAAGLSLALAVGPLRAQTGGEGLFLLLPVGARAVSMGESVVAERGGSEQVWWNPAGIAGTDSIEIAIHHSQTLVGQGNTVSTVIPTRRLGTFALSVNLLDLGQQSVTDPNGGELGVISPIDVAYVLTYAIAPVGGITLGVSLKHVEMRMSCSGFCADVPLGGSKANGFDVGTTVRVPKIPLTLGGAIRNLGVGTGDTKPGRVDIGGRYRIDALDRYTKEVEVYAAGNVVTTTGLDSASTRIGADVVIEKRIHLRTGYIVDHANGSGAAIGFGIGAGRFVFDLARTFGGLAAERDQPPTYFSLRYLW